MFRLWGKLIKDSKIIKSETIVREEDDTRTHKIFNSLDELCKMWDLGSPIWLEANINEFKRLSKTRFYQDSFIEDVDFDFMEIQIIEET
ncbi:MAG TPA: hypothetical protein IAB17_02775 [Candidatus Alectryocaccobium stercorigallinarum]|nr:hypothetical protein [Candidatus Alectryocaccobium stercorigallinarum]